VKGFSSISSKETLEEVSKKIRGAMQERGAERRRKSESGSGSGGWDFAGSGSGSGGEASEAGERDA